MFMYTKVAIGEKDAKTGRKSTSDTADKLLCIPVRASRRPGSAPLPHPGLVVGTPGSQAALQAVFDKRKACLDEKRSRFNLFCTCFRTVPVFIV